VLLTQCELTLGFEGKMLLLLPFGAVLGFFLA
jgi:hypothetical protein